MYTTLNASRNYLYNVSRACDKGHVCSKDCAGVVLFTAENSVKIALDAIQCLGNNKFQSVINAVYCDLLRPFIINYNFYVLLTNNFK